MMILKALNFVYNFKKSNLPGIFYHHPYRHQRLGMADPKTRITSPNAAPTATYIDVDAYDDDDDGDDDNDY